MMFFGQGRKRKGCGTCEYCNRTEDCGECKFCLDKYKFGGPNKLKQVCEKKKCLIFEPVSKLYVIVIFYDLRFCITELNICGRSHTHIESIY